MSKAKIEAETKAISPTIAEAAAAGVDLSKLYAVTRYLQLRPKGSYIAETAFKKKYAKEAHTIPDWDVLWDKFLNQKV